MEARIAKLEAAVEHVIQDVTELRSDNKDVRDRLRTVEVKIDHLPGKGFIVTALLGAIAVITTLAAYADTIRAIIQ